MLVCPKTLTSAVPLIRPVATVVLPVTFPPVGDAVAIVTLELEVVGAVRGFCGVFWGDEPHRQSAALHQCEQTHQPDRHSLLKAQVPGQPAQSDQTQVRQFLDPTSRIRTHASLSQASGPYE